MQRSRGDLLDFVPTMPGGVADRQASLRGAMASTLIAGLELTREGRVHLHQDAAFTPIRVEAAPHPRSSSPLIEEAQ